MKEKPYYGYRIMGYATHILIGAGVVNIASAIIFAMSMYSTWLLVLCWILGVLLLISGVFWHLSMGWLNDRGKVEHLQDVSLNLLATIWNGKGKVLDIGTGLGRVAVEMARQFPEARVTGVDTWSKFWKLFGMTKKGAWENAKITGVSDRCRFRHGDATSLPFNDEEFQLVVSSFAFHEVRISDRTVLFKEVVRVLAPGGYFGICDLFPKGYKVKSIQELLWKIEQIGVEDVKFKTLKEVGINLGGLSHIWGIGYLSGRKPNNVD